VEIVIFCIFCLAGILCAAPLALDIEGKSHARLDIRFRYLFFRRNISGILRNKLRLFARRLLKSPDFLKILKLYAPLFRRPLRVKHLRLNLAFSAGDAAETAVFHGGLCSLANSLCPPVAGGKPEITLNPRFSAETTLSFDCNISLSVPAAVLLFRLIVLSVKEKAIQLFGIRGGRVPPRRTRLRRSPLCGERPATPPCPAIQHPRMTAPNARHDLLIRENHKTGR
jgi:hypothetical protein